MVNEMDKVILLSTENVAETERIGRLIGKRLKGGEVIEFVSDLGGGKTQLVRGLAEGAGSQDGVQSPSFTISRIYKTDSFDISHFDFHRLNDPGIMKHELLDIMDSPDSVVAIEWADHVRHVLPADRLVINIKVVGENQREIKLEATGPKHQHLIKDIK